MNNKAENNNKENKNNAVYSINRKEDVFVISVDGFDFEVRNGLITSVYKNNNMVFNYLGEDQ